jgi:phenylpyruvate tautomerase PptA (4-oxalocrotonate tautomerase family)
MAPTEVKGDIMPIFFIEAPKGVRDDAKKLMVEKMTADPDEAWHVPDVRVFIREYAVENVAQDGRFQSEPMRPVGSLHVPLLRSVDTKRKVAEKLQAAFAEAYAGIANTSEFLVFMNEYPLENAFSGGRLQSDNPEIVEGMKLLNGVGV